MVHEWYNNIYYISLELPKKGSKGLDSSSPSNLALTHDRVGKPPVSAAGLKLAPFVLFGLLLFLDPSAVALFPTVSSCTLPITSRSVAVCCFVPLTCALGFNGTLCNLLFVVIIVCVFFLFCSLAALF